MYIFFIKRLLEVGYGTTTTFKNFRCLEIISQIGIVVVRVY